MRRFICFFTLMMAFCLTGGAAAQDTAQNHIASARSFYEQNDLDAALREIEAALALQNGNATAHYWKGRIALRRDDLKEAENAFRRAISQDRNSPEAYVGLGDVIRLRKNRKLDAIEIYGDALKRDPNHVDAQYKLATLYRDITFGDVAPFGMFQPMYLGRGLEALHRTLELDPNHPSANYDLGLLYETGMNNLEKAITHYTRQVESNPENTESLDRLGRSFFRTGQYREGVVTLNRLIRQHPVIKEKALPTLTMLEATLALKNGQYEQAQTTFETFIHTLDPEEQRLYEDVTLLMSEAELKRYEAMTPEQQTEHRRKFWKQKDADPTTTANERLIEHYRRVLYARNAFGEKRFPWDRRGELYIRYGDPDDRQSFTLSIGEMQETNQGSRRPTSVPTVQDVSDAIRESAQSHALERQVYAPTGNPRVDHIREMNFQQRYQMAVEASTVGLSAYRVESWVYVPMGVELFFVDQLNNGVFDFPLMTQSRDVRQVARQGEYHPARLAAEMIRKTPEMYQHNFGGEPLMFYYDVVTFQGEGNRSDVEIAFSVPTYQMGAQTDGRGTETSLETRITLMDGGWNELARAEERLGPFSRPVFLQSSEKSASMATFQIPVSALPDEGELAVAVRDAVTRKIGLYRQEISIPSYTAPTLLMSDIRLASSIKPTLVKRGPFIRNNLEIVPNPTHIFARNQMMNIYYELYNLTRDDNGQARFQTDITVSAGQEQTSILWRLISGVGRWIAGSDEGRVLTFRIEDGADTTSVTRYTAIDISGSPPGRYTLEVQVTDLLSNLAMTRKTELRITEAIARLNTPENPELGEPSPVSAENTVMTPEVAAPDTMTDPLTATTRANQDWSELVRTLQNPEYLIAGQDSLLRDAEDSTVTTYMAALSQNINRIEAGGRRIVEEEYPDMVFVPAGMFLMGSDSAQPDEGPMRNVFLEAFYIDKYEVTNEQYRRFIEATGHTPPGHWIEGMYPEGESRYPVVGVSWLDATAYAQWAGKRLPTEREWEKAARGDDGRLYPWGDDFVPYWLNIKGESDVYERVAPAGSFPEGISPYGVYDMAGNVEEWTADWFDRYEGNSHENSAYGQQFRVIRGGSWVNFDGNTRTHNRGKFYPSDTSLLLGFRCVRDARPEEKTIETMRGYGYLHIATPGAWADIYIDGERLGQTPQADPLRLRPGAHTLRLVNPYFEVYENTVDIEAEAVQKQRVVLEIKPEP